MLSAFCAFHLKLEAGVTFASSEQLIHIWGRALIASKQVALFQGEQGQGYVGTFISHFWKVLPLFISPEHCNLTAFPDNNNSNILGIHLAPTPIT